MIKNRSKSKIKHTVALPKKHPDLSHKNTSRKTDEKQNGLTSLRLTQAVGASKKKNKLHQESQSTNKSKSKSSSQFGASMKNNTSKKLDDQKFIDKLFSKTQKVNEKQPSFVQQLIEEIVPTNNKKNISGSDIQITSSEKIQKLEQKLENKSKQSRMLFQELEQLKLYVSSFTFKVFDLTVLCKKILGNSFMEREKSLLNQKVGEVVAYIESLVRQWNLQEKIKLHTESTFRKGIKPCSDVQPQRSVELKKRCHTQSLKIPLQEYLENMKQKQANIVQKQSIKCTYEKMSINTIFESREQSTQKIEKRNICKFQIPLEKLEEDAKHDESEEIMRIVSRRNSEVKKEDDEIYVVLRSYEPKNVHELKLRNGDRITVLDKSNPQRWVGLKDGVIGYFPKELLF